MDVVMKSLTAVWQVALGALVLGAGLPALFALGLRSLYGKETLLTTAGGDPQLTKPTAIGRVGAAICFGIVVAAVIFGIVVIVLGKQLFGS